LLSPANRHDAPWTTPLLGLTHAWFAFPVQVVRADAASFTLPSLALMLIIVRLTPKVVFQIRKAGNRLLVT
jgi:hypothetical protein